MRLKYTNAPAKSVVFTPFSALEPVKFYVEPIYALVTRVGTCYPVHMQKPPIKSAFFLSHDAPNRCLKHTLHKPKDFKNFQINLKHKDVKYKVIIFSTDNYCIELL